MCQDSSSALLAQKLGYHQFCGCLLQTGDSVPEISGGVWEALLLVIFYLRNVISGDSAYPLDVW